MTIKVVIDSSADLPARLVEELGITVVPLYVRFGDEVYRDRVDISEDEFYQRLLHDPVHPSTTQPTPQDFANVYQKLSKQADGIISIHISTKLSGTCSSALQAKEMVGKGCPIEVIDSQMATMGIGMTAIAAATMTMSGKSLPQVVEDVKQIVANTRLLGLLDTLKYLALGGRIGKAKALLGSVLNVKPVLTLKDGEVVPAGQVRTRDKGIDKLLEFVENATDIQDLSVIYNTTPDEAQSLAERIGSVYDKERIRFARLGPVLGVHCGPDILFVALREK
ncbi:MAG: fatty acid-binding protein DegV [Dehalococcoidales bacterium]|nr:fatty acid-binding protein DegV [Dehalococcoidales bacterium]